MPRASRGRPNGSAHKPWADAVRLAASRLDKATKRKRLDMLAEALVSEALGGDIPALKEIGDRLDGKAPQALTAPEGSAGGALMVTWLPAQ